MLRYLLLFMFPVLVASCSTRQAKPPNIIIIYADDMGFGDLAIQNPDSRIPTPHLDNLASQGMRFSDAHSSSGICSPSRFALLTGTYHWRRQHGIVGPFGPPFFKDSDVTLPQILREGGYETACIGKWHLGWNWNFSNEPSGEVMQWGANRKVYLPGDIDWTKPISGGPLDRGFDYYFGDGTINFPPYVWMENDRVLKQPDETLLPDNIGYSTKEGEWEFRPGPRVQGWNPYEVLPTLADTAVSWVAQRNPDRPFFLYFSLPSPHAPIIPNDEFDGSSEAGAYGDFIVQTDHIIGQLLQALDDSGLAENTIVIFTADNGPEKYAFERAQKYEHYSMGQLRGLKRDVWEGGHHVPFIIRWPSVVEPGTVSEEVISQVDLMRTLSAVTGTPLPEHAAADSYDLSPILFNSNYVSPLREATVHNTFANVWALRQGEMLYINAPSGGHTKMPDYFMELRNYADFESEGLLFDLENDPEQRINLYDQHPEMVKAMDSLLTRYRTTGSSLPGK